MTNIKGCNKFHNFRCNDCDYNTCRKSQYDRHILTNKHMQRINTNNDEAEKFQKVPSNIKQYTCICGKIFKHASSLWNHKQKVNCTEISNTNNIPTISNTNSNIDMVQMTEMFKYMMTQNQEFMADIFDKVMPNIGNNSHNNTNSNNTTNNQFNIQMFLNDHCKNAMNLTDFIQSLPITSETYDSTIENGLTKTITSMMVNGLNELDILERPIHCTDATRKTLYVKNSDTWEKDNELLYILKGIKELSLKQRTLISKWREVNEGWQTDENLQSKMTNLVFNSMTQIESDEKETGKIIRSISKNVYLDNETKQSYK
jgi:hypothetical protein